ncbi:TPA: hypothetical protein KSK13_003478 [Clostridioides difficile]|nr:hypothetical protein [Clostridioides difficile]
MQTEWNFVRKSEGQIITLNPGKYKLECWGARGGAYGTPPSSGSYYYGYGGYSCGELILKKETVLYVFVGFDGKKGNSFNGGGYGASASGGGATDIRLVGGSWDNEQGLLSRIIVAGGGGGTIDRYEGGNGGGLNGGTGRDFNGAPAHGGTQYEGGKGSLDDGSLDGSFGKGATPSNPSAMSGGGGGWFGGSLSSGAGYGSGGGSGYVLTKDSYKLKGYIPTSEYWLKNASMTTGGNRGGSDGYSDGRAKITLLQALPFLTVSSYNSTTATFKVDHTDPTLLTKIEIFIDDILKETITADLTTEKTINYTLEDNALHTLKIVVTDSNNATAEKVVNISEGIAPLPNGSSLEEVTNKWREIGEAFKSGKTSIVSTLALKNVSASLDNTLFEFSDKIKTFFDSSDATTQQLQNQINSLTTQLLRSKKFASGFYIFTQNDRDTFYSEYRPTPLVKTLTVPINLDFVPSLIIIEQINLYDGYIPKYYGINNLNKLTSAGYALTNGGKDYKLIGYMYINSISSKSFTINTFRDSKVDSSISIYRCQVGESFRWYAYQ